MKLLTTILAVGAISSLQAEKKMEIRMERDHAANAACDTGISQQQLERETETNYNFRASGIHGAGFQNVVAIDPFDPNIVLSGGDVTPIHRSDNRGQSWTGSNYGIGSQANGVASIIFSKKTKGVVYAAVGSRGDAGGFYVSHDSGATWERLSDVPQFWGGNTRQDPLPQEHPRSTGYLIALDEKNSIIYAGTFKNGVMRSADGGKTWTNIGHTGKYIRSIGLDPKTPETLFVAPYGDGVYRVENAHTDNPVFVQIAPEKMIVEELTFVGSSLYIVGTNYPQLLQKAGHGKQYGSVVYRSTDMGASFERLLYVPYEKMCFRSVAGYVKDGREVVYAGAVNPQRVNDLCTTFFKTEDSGKTWKALPETNEQVHSQLGGSGEQWWLLSQNKYPLLGQSGSVAASIAIDPQNPERVYSAGRSGIWRSENGGADWYPAVANMNVTVNRVAMANPGRLGGVFIGNTDWVCFRSTDWLKTIHQVRPDNSGSVAYALAAATDGDFTRVFLATGNRDNNTNGEMFMGIDPALASDFKSMGLGSVVENRRPLAMAVYNPVKPVIRRAFDGGVQWQVAGKNFVTEKKMATLTLAAGEKTKAIGAQGKESKGILSFSMKGDIVISAFLRDGYTFSVSQNNFAVQKNNEILEQATYVVESGKKYWMRYETRGSTTVQLRARIWQEGEEEPIGWTLSHTDRSGLSVGNIGFAARSISGGQCNLYGIWVDEVIGSSESPIVVTAVDHDGIYRMDEKRWTKSNATALFTTNSNQIYWPDGSELVYAYERRGGVFRSNDYGKTWTMLWALSESEDGAGYVAADPMNPTTLYVARSNGVYRIKNADKSTVNDGGLTAELLNGISVPSVITVDPDGYLYAATNPQTFGTPKGVFRYDESAGAFVEISDEVFRGTVGSNTSLSVSVDGTVYVPFIGSGVYIGERKINH